MKDHDESNEESHRSSEHGERCDHERGGRPCMRQRGHDGDHEWRALGCSITWKG